MTIILLAVSLFLSISGNLFLFFKISDLEMKCINNANDVDLQLEAMTFSLNQLSKGESVGEKPWLK